MYHTLTCAGLSLKRKQYNDQPHLPCMFSYGQEQAKSNTYRKIRRQRQKSHLLHKDLIFASFLFSCHVYITCISDRDYSRRDQTRLILDSSAICVANPINVEVQYLTTG